MNAPLEEFKCIICKSKKFPSINELVKHIKNVHGEKKSQEKIQNEVHERVKQSKNVHEKSKSPKRPNLLKRVDGEKKSKDKVHENSLSPRQLLYYERAKSPKKVHEKVKSPKKVHEKAKSSKSFHDKIRNILQNEVNATKENERAGPKSSKKVHKKVKSPKKVNEKAKSSKSVHEKVQNILQEEPKNIKENIKCTFCNSDGFENRKELIKHIKNVHEKTIYQENGIRIKQEPISDTEETSENIHESVQKNPESIQIKKETEDPTENVHDEIYDSEPNSDIVHENREIQEDPETLPETSDNFQEEPETSENSEYFKSIEISLAKLKRKVHEKGSIKVKADFYLASMEKPQVSSSLEHEYRPYKCDICQLKSFTEQKFLDIHKKIVHEGMIPIILTK